MRLSVRFTNIKMIMIEEGFCKNAWTSDIKRPEATRRHRSKGKSREFEILEILIYFKWKGMKKSCLEYFLRAPLRSRVVCSMLLREQYHTRQNLVAIEGVLDINFQYLNRQTSWINMRR